MAYCCMNDFAGMTANFTTPHFSADLPILNTAMKNLEFKANCDSLDMLRQRLASLQAEHRRTMKQLDTYFNIPQGRLKLREINTDEAQLIYYERSDLAESRYSNYQVCDISETDGFHADRDDGLGGERCCREAARVVDVWRHAHPSRRGKRSRSVC